MAWRPLLQPELLGLLPDVYATVLRMRAAGADDEEVAEAVGVPAAAVGLLVDVAERKLRRVAARA